MYALPVPSMLTSKKSHSTSDKKSSKANDKTNTKKLVSVTQYIDDINRIKNTLLNQNSSPPVIAYYKANLSLKIYY